MAARIFQGRPGKEAGEARPLGAALRPVGRVAVWAVLIVLLVRGGEAVVGSPEGGSTRILRATPAGPGAAAEGLAVGFARAYLESSSGEGLRPYLADGVHLELHRPTGAGVGVAQAEVVRSAPLGAGRWILTVSCDLRDARVLDLAVPVARKGAGSAAALGAPSIVADPAPAGADPERPRPIAGPGAGALGELVSKFLPAYVSATSSSQLTYLLSPGATVVPLGGTLELASAGHPEQLGDGEGPRRELLVDARLRDPGSGTTYPVAYRLRSEERAGRWYVAAVEGALA